MVTVADLIAELEEIAPPELAEDDDRIGLQAGNTSMPLNRVCVSVDTSSPVILKAIERQAQILVSHHPLIYKPMTSMAESNPVAARLAALIRAKTALFVMHTNYDTAPGGINDVLAQKLGVLDGAPLTNRKQDKFYKIAVFVPEEAVEQVRNAMAEAGAGRIGQYTHCSFRSQGTGSFVPMPAACPYIGKIGKLEEVNEYKLEMVVAGGWLDIVLEEMIEKHPYDEVAYDVYELANEPIIYGYGRVGTLEKETSLVEFSGRVKDALELEYVKVAGDPDKKIKRVALCGGSGSSLFKEAVMARADVLVTGDTKHHDILDAAEYGLAMIDAGHWGTEKPGMLALVERLDKIFAGNGLEIEYIE